MKIFIPKHDLERPKLLKDCDCVSNFYKKYYPEAEISVATSMESESMKIFCNCYYASKIQIFNEYYLLCEKNGSDYKKIIGLMLKNGWINPMHTNVPGPDGSLSYGSLLSKDTNALLQYMKNTDTQKVLKTLS